ncbi:fungal specific transcription factor domain containing protein [Grosmannia clavigera kw1407]|uniref:Fungal specific transcription factor domain containing protein n=1 Tax=Grosmannia clavigera (strain kw1407 / UAMH 11150) TaxID=655863 RepID=F0XMR7_GROCL|nr:fungal specific transcription factor domain containing protein [Grosmannia clavigera kw1407]EFX01511.1 fungal specific transcription factor domain containing protein [Grosmannia clavigera kw1407]
MYPSMTAPQKQRRQATACDYCRSHKVKCDAEQPSCRNCVRRGIECVTVNLRNPGLDGTRQLPLGRRRKDAPRTLDNSSAVWGERIDTAARPADEPETVKYPPSPLQPAERTFEARSPSSILPGVFTSPFHEDTRDPTASVSRTGSPSTRSLNNSTPSLPLLADKNGFRAQAVGSGSSLCFLVQWLDLYFSQCPTWTPILPFIQQGLAYSMEVPLPFSVGPPLLPSSETAKKYTALFFSRVHPVFPVINRDAFEASLDVLRAKVACVPMSLESRDYPLLACAYAVFSAAADEEASAVSPEGTKYLQGAYLLYGQLVATPHYTSVQALLLLTLILYNRSKNGASWGTLSQAVRIAQSIGLHRHVPPSGSVPATLPMTPGNAADENLFSRIWWAAYTLERMMELESGRPSAIYDGECNQIIPTVTAGTLAPGCSFDYFRALVQLSQIQSRAIVLLHSNKTQRKSFRLMLREQGRIDRALVDWTEGFPESIRMIALHRPALVSSPGFLRNRINEYCAGTPWRDRLHFSLCIGVASARAMLKAYNDLLMYVGPTRLITANQILLATLVLGIYITKNPLSRLKNSDLAMLSTFSESIEEEYVMMGQDLEFAKGMQTLRQQLSDNIGSHRPGPLGIDQVAEAAIQPKGVEMDSLLPGFDFNTTVDFNTGLANLEDSWSHLWNEDFGGWTYSNDEQDTTNMYVLGLPQSWT